MTRHQRNATANTVYTYHERRKDARQSGYGSLTERLGKDSVKGFDCCCLTLQPCIDPVVTPEGCLFDRAAFLEYIINTKRDNQRKLALWQQQQQERQHEHEKEQSAQHDKKVKRFLSQQATPTVDRTGGSDNDEDQQPEGSAGTSSGSGGGAKKHKLPSFWVPDQLPAAKRRRMEEKPDAKVRCPVSGHPLKARDVIAVKFTPIPEAQRSADEPEAKYWCPISHDVLTQTTEMAVLRPSGLVVSMDSVRRLVLPEMKDPLSGEALRPEDIVPLQRGGTGFAHTNQQLMAKMHRPNIELQ